MAGCSSGWDGVGSGVKYEYDLAGAQRRIMSMGGASQELEYDARGRITGIVDGNGSETKYLLDEWGRITGVVKADGSTERYAYNFAGDMSPPPTARATPPSMSTTAWGRSRHRGPHRGAGNLSLRRPGAAHPQDGPQRRDGGVGVQPLWCSPVQKGKRRRSG